MQPPCIYDITASWAHNLQRGPLWQGPLPERVVPPPEQWVDFLGFKVASRVGVPAGPLLDSRWTTLAARLGYDIVTYKTIRTQPSTGHAPPNVLYLAAQDQLPAADDGTPLQAAGQQLPAASQPAAHEDTQAAAAAAAAAYPALPAELAITNSFGMPSRDRTFLLQDIPAATAALGPGQLLVVSVTGSPGRPGVSFVDDFVEAALLAQQAGAKVVEANLSCPNVGTGQGSLYTDPEQVEAVCLALVAALGPATPLVIKVGAFAADSSPGLLERVLLAAARAGARGVAGINGLSRRIVDGSGAPALGPDRPTSGVCGAPIRCAALQFVTAARALIDARGLDMALIGVGGVSTPQHVADMLAAGADVVQSATGMMWNPLLAQECHALGVGVQGRRQPQRQDTAAAATAAAGAGAGADSGTGGVAMAHAAGQPAAAGCHTTGAAGGAVAPAVVRAK